MTMIPTMPDGGQTEANQGRSMLVQWFPQWCGWYNKSATSNTPTPTTSSLDSPLLSPSHHQPSTAFLGEPPKDQTQLEDEILNALAGSVENNSLLKRDAVFGKFNFILKKGTLDVCTGTSAQIPLNQTVASKLMLQLQFENLLLTIESRPRSASHFVGLSLGSIFVKDHITVDSEFPDLIRPQQKDEPIAPLVIQSRLHRVSRFAMNAAAAATMSQPVAPASPAVAASPPEPLFQMNYERKPLTYNTDYRLQIKSQSLDIVYNVDAINWIVDFVMKPHQLLSARRKIEAMKNKTKMELIKSWEQVLEGDLSERKSWSLEIDISAPQIIFAENFHMKNGSIVVIDFGRLQLQNSGNGDQTNERQQQQQSSNVSGAAAATAAAASDLLLMHRDSEDEEAFMTPCSTPPGSECSTTDSPTLCSALSDPMAESIVVNPGDAGLLNEKSLHHKLYDSYSMNLTDMQVLVCKSKERWSFASAKGSSTLHLLDRFSISLQFERRVVLTLDPQYPSLTMSGSLPKLVAHVNEHKIAAITQMLNTLSVVSGGGGGQSPQKVIPFEETIYDRQSSETTMGSMPDVNVGGGGTGGGGGATEEDQQREASKMIILQFSIDQMALEVQSRGRSIAELQVTGVKAGFSKRVEDTSFTLSVHGLLLVDAIQSFGPDFELLIASHRHVGFVQFLMFIFDNLCFLFEFEKIVILLLCEVNSFLKIVIMDTSTVKEFIEKF